MEELEENNRVMKSELRPKPKDCSVEVNQVSARWTTTSKTDDLSDVSFKSVPGDLTAIVGEVGSGKVPLTLSLFWNVNHWFILLQSSILNTILGELPIQKGSIQVKGKISYACQEPWLFSGSVKQNILFGQPYIAKRYHEVVRGKLIEVIIVLKRNYRFVFFSSSLLIGTRLWNTSWWR